MNAELRRLRCREIAVADLAINSCQVMNVFANFLFGANKSWRGKNVIQCAPKVTTYFAAKQRRARTRAKRRRAVRGMSCSVVVQLITGTSSGLGSKKVHEQGTIAVRWNKCDVHFAKSNSGPAIIL